MTVPFSPSSDVRRELLQALLRRPQDEGRLARGCAAARPLRLRLRRLPRVHGQPRARCRLRARPLPRRRSGKSFRARVTSGSRRAITCAAASAGCRRASRATRRRRASTSFSATTSCNTSTTASAVRALANLGRLSRGALYFSVLTAEDWRRNADRARTDSGVRLRPAAWYKARLLRHFRPVGGGLLVRRGYDPLLWELERPWTKGASRERDVHLRSSRM